MKVVMIGNFPEAARRRWEENFPEDWELTIVPPEAAAGELAEAEAVIPEHIRVDAAFLAQAPRLRLVQTGAGYDNVDIPACTARGVRVCNAAGVNAAAVAEHVMALLLCRYKNIAYLDAFMKRGGEEAALDYTGAELAGKTVGILGLGAVGSRVARCCRAFDMRVLAHSRHGADPSLAETVSLERLYAESDILTVHVPLTAATRHLLGREAFRQMKGDALLINTSRGAVLDEAALVEALRTGEIGGACLDVYEQEPLPPEHPLRTLPNVILTPHTAGLPDGVKFHKKRCAFFVSNIQRVLNGQEPENALNTL